MAAGNCAPQGIRFWWKCEWHLLGTKSPNESGATPDQKPWTAKRNGQRQPASAPVPPMLFRFGRALGEVWLDITFHIGDLLALQPPPSRGNDAKNKSGECCCISTGYTPCFSGGHVIASEPTLDCVHKEHINIRKSSKRKML